MVKVLSVMKVELIRSRHLLTEPLSHQLKSFNNEDARDNIYVTLPKPILEKIVVDYKELHSIIDQQEIR